MPPRLAATGINNVKADQEEESETEDNKDADKDQDKDADKGKLTSKEVKQAGSVNWKHYRSYLKSMTIWKVT